MTYHYGRDSVSDLHVRLLYKHLWPAANQRHNEQPFHFSVETKVLTEHEHKIWRKT
jgi:hypothetical protein